MRNFVLAVLLCVSFFACNKNKDSVAELPATLNEIKCKGHFCVGYKVCFSVTGTGIKQYSWELGDGSIATEASPCHAYTDTGLFIVKLKINNDTALTKQLMIYVSKVPVFTYLLNGSKTWRHTIGLALSGGWDTTYAEPDATFSLTYIDPVCISIGADTFTFVRSVPQYDSILYYSRSYTNTANYSVSQTVTLHHTAAGDSIRYSTHARQSLGGVTREDFYCP